jgi:hypothetical protein
MPTLSRRCLPPASLVCLFLTAAGPLVAQGAPRKKILFPSELAETSLEARSKAQFATLDQFEVFYFFNFTDRTAESGITFLNQVVDDAGRDYKAVHYDHGNGIAVADVDGDGLHDIYLTNQVGPNELWRNRGGGKFENVTQRAGVGMEDRISVTASFGDIDNDGDPDLFVTTVKMGNSLFENDGRGIFTDITEEAGVDHVGHSSGAIFFDFDLDGLLDLFVTNIGVYSIERQGRHGYYIGAEHAFSGHLFPERTETSLLYRNLGANRFADVSAKVGLVDGSWSGDASAVDLNGDRYPDLYLLNMQGDDHFYVNQEGRRFVDRTVEHFPKTPWGAMGIKFLDFDNDGLSDLLLTDMHSDMSENIGPEREKLKSRMRWSEEQIQDGSNNLFGNAFYRNVGDGKFEEISDRVGAESYWPWGVSAGDLNADGWEDLFITAGMNYPFRYGVNTLLLNNRGKKLLDSEFVLGIEPRKGEKYSQPWFDLDCSGSDQDHRHCEGEVGPVTVYGAVGTRSSAIFDLEGDGDLDIVTNEFHAPPMVLVSDLSEQTELKFLEIQLVGRRSNRDGLGARVAVTAGDLVQTKIHDGKSGYLSQSSLPLYFGLGEEGKVQRIEIQWPSGVRQVVDQGIELNRLLVIEEEVEPPVGPPSATSGSAENPPSVCEGPKRERAHKEVLNPRWVPVRQLAQQIMSRDYTVDFDFRFTDRIEESGIRFRHQIVEDAGKRYKAVHYDHGNGLAAADVNGDGRLDLYFTSQLGSNGLWENRGGGKFRDITRESQVAVADRISVAPSFADTDNDGDPDLFVSTVRQGNLMFENVGGRFVDITEESGLGHVGHSSGAIFFDYDRDGLLDLFVTNVGRYTKDEQGPGGYWIGLTDAFSGHLYPERYESSILYRNLGNNRFADVSTETGLVDSSWSGDASPLDLNEDGWLDLYVLNMQGHDEYYENVGGRRFEKKSRQIFPRTAWGAMGIRVLDFNNDGLMDIYTTDMHTDMIETPEFMHEKNKMARQRPLQNLGTDGNHVLGNAFYRNDGGGGFTEVSDEVGAENFWPWGLSSGDLNADGFEDVFIAASMNYPYRYGVNSLLLNQGGERFVDVEYLVGIEPRKGGRTANPWFELDCSGDDRDHNDCEGMEGCIVVMGALGSRSSVIFDLEGDGDLDIVTNDFNSEPMVLVSDLSERRPVHFLEVDLVGKRSNRSGLGARVRVHAGASSYTKVNDGKSGYLSQSDLPLYFGLGAAESVDRIEIDWPSGIRQVVSEGIEIDRRLTIEEESP